MNTFCTCTHAQAWLHMHIYALACTYGRCVLLCKSQPSSYTRLVNDWRVTCKGQARCPKLFRHVCTFAQLHVHTHLHMWLMNDLCIHGVGLPQGAIRTRNDEVREQHVSCMVCKGPQAQAARRAGRQAGLVIACWSESCACICMQGHGGVLAQALGGMCALVTLKLPWRTIEPSLRTTNYQLSYH